MMLAAGPGTVMAARERRAAPAQTSVADDTAYAPPRRAARRKGGTLAALASAVFSGVKEDRRTDAETVAFELPKAASRDSLPEPTFAAETGILGPGTK